MGGGLAYHVGVGGDLDPGDVLAFDHSNEHVGFYKVDGATVRIFSVDFEGAAAPGGERRLQVLEGKPEMSTAPHSCHGAFEEVPHPYHGAI